MSRVGWLSVTTTPPSCSRGRSSSSRASGRAFSSLTMQQCLNDASTGAQTATQVRLHRYQFGRPAADCSAESHLVKLGLSEFVADPSCHRNGRKSCGDCFAGSPGGLSFSHGCHKASRAALKHRTMASASRRSPWHSFRCSPVPSLTGGRPELSNEFRRPHDLNTFTSPFQFRAPVQEIRIQSDKAHASATNCVH